MQRIDVVTGGASAAYGSDAVAGVVNIVLDKKFFWCMKGQSRIRQRHMPLSISKPRSTLSAGTRFCWAARVTLILSGDHTWSTDPVWFGQAPWWDNGAIVPNPKANSLNGLPMFIHVRNTGQGQYTQGGLIRGNTAGGTWEAASRPTRWRERSS